MARTATDRPELPDLPPGVCLLDTDDVTGALHSLVVDAVCRGSAPAWWVDARGRARTRPLARVAPDPRVLERINVARGFTAHQHHALVRAAADRADGLVVAPALDAPYRGDDLRADEGREMLVRGLAALSGVARRQDLPVLVTRRREDALSEPIARAAERRIRCTSTPHGPRFVGDGVETLVYPGEGFVQTTFAFWERVLAARQPSAGEARDEPWGSGDEIEPQLGGSGTDPAAPPTSASEIPAAGAVARPTTAAHSAGEEVITRGAD